MAPTRRSSLTGTPSNPNTPTTTPRKTPHCTKCNRPRAGHPHQGCPYADSDLGTSGTNCEPEREPEQEKITNALGSMTIGSPGHKSTRRSSVKSIVPDPTLASLSTNSSEIVGRLLIPGIMDEDTDEEEEERLARWQEGVVPTTPVKGKGRGVPRTPTKGKGNHVFVRSPMPGTLNSPSPSFFQSTQSDMSVKGDIGPLPAPSVATAVRASRPLARSMTAEERELFLLRLDTTSTAPSATVYVLPKANISALEHAAMKLGFHSRVVLDHKENRTQKLKGICKGDESENDNGWLILGRDERAVQELYEGVKLGKVDDGQESLKGSGRLSAAAGGLIVGAVATFTGLAYS